MILRRMKSSWRVAGAAVCMLVLQSMGGALASGASSASFEFDAFGNPICATSSDGVHSSGSQDGNSHRRDCCTLGCSISAQPAAALPEDARLPVSHQMGTAKVGGPWRLCPEASSIDDTVHFP